VSNTTTSVYRYYDGRGALLYVGITSRGIKRNYEHNHTQDWWHFAATQTIEHYDRRDDAERRERELIREFRPPFNSAHNPDHEAFRMAYILSYSHYETKQRIPLTDLETTGAWREIPLEITAQKRGLVIVTTPPEYIEVISRVMWEQSESRIVMDGCNVGSLRHTYVNDAGFTWHYEIAEEITQVHDAFVSLKRNKSGRTFLANYVSVTADLDPQLLEANRLSKNSIAKRYPLRQSRKAPSPSKMKRVNA
jgi:hypothetical protein